LHAGEADPYVFAMTSAVPGEGVTTVVTGAALALAANTTERVVIVDTNLRHPALHRFMGTPLAPGFHELVTAAASREPCQKNSSAEASATCAYKTRLPNLWVIPAGALASNPAKLLTSDAAKAQIDLLRAQFRYVILDCPPVLAAVEATSLCRLADGVALVVRANHTPREDIQKAQEALDGACLLGAILNGI